MFKEIPANKSSLKARRPLLGVGINDANYKTNKKIDGKSVVCPFYRKWSDMIKRCYSDKYKKKNPTYIGCSVCDEWLVFSVFKSWMEKQDWQGKQLDKDLSINGNKIYSPEACVFTTAKNNSVAASAKWYKMMSPSGEIVIIYNMSEFCRINSLNHRSMSKLHNNHIESHKGWTKSI